MTTLNAINAIKSKNEANGGHFFDEGALKFFSSIILPKVYKGQYFITSERFDHKSPRLFTVRQACPDGDIETVGKFQQFETVEDAIEYIEKL